MVMRTKVLQQENYSPTRTEIMHDPGRKFLKKPMRFFPQISYVIMHSLEKEAEVTCFLPSYKQNHV